MSDGDRPPSHAQGRPLASPEDWPTRAPASPELVERLNREWRVTAPATSQPSLKRRLAAPVRAALAAFLRPQETFNSVVVQRLNQLGEMNDLATQRQDWLRTMVHQLFERLDRLETLLATEMTAVVDELRRSPDALAARERRMEAAMVALRDEHADIRAVLGVLRHETQHLSKSLAGARSAASPGSAHVPQMPAAESADPLTHKYVGFEDQFRGSAEAISAGLAAYVPLFAGASDVLDIGCGRGEFLSLLRESGVGARGIDLNESMVEVCRGRGLEAAVADALTYLRGQPDGSLGGIFAAQVVEHLKPGYLTQLLDAASVKLRPGGLIVLETINPACWFAFFSSYIRDITHERALHPDTLKFLLVASGFEQVTIRYSAPYPEHEKLQAVTAAGIPADAAETLNANVAKINQLLFTHLDYAAIGRRGNRV